MKIAIILVGWISAASMLLAGGDDLIRFSAGDQLRGKFEGFGSGGEVNWRCDDVDAPVDLKAGGVKYVVFRGGKAYSRRTLAHLGLVNGDRSGNREKIQMRHSLLGAIGLSLESAVMLNFDGSKYAVDDWDDEF